jgi:hypothetical protein
LFQTSGIIKFTNQRQFLRQCFNEGLLFSSLTEINTEIAETTIGSLRSNFNELDQHKAVLDDLIFKLYGISKNEQKRMLS